MLRRVTSHSVPVLLALALPAGLLGRWDLAAAVGAGGLVGLLHLRGVARTARAVTGGVRRAGPVVFLSLFRLALVGAVLFLLVREAGLHPVALLAGFGVVHLFLMVAGMKDARQAGGPDS